MAREKKAEWIQGAINPAHRGQLRSAARRADAVTKRGTIDTDWLRTQASSPGKGGRPAQARLALRLRRFHRRKSYSA